MKLFKILFIAVCTCFSLILPLPVDAAGASISATSTNVTVGESVTINAYFKAAAWNISVSGSGISGGSYASQTSDLSEAENSYSYSLDTSTAGTYTITMSGDITDENGTTSMVNQTVQVVVTEPTPPPAVNPDPDPAPTPDPDPTPTPDPGPVKSDDARLISLKVDKGELNPAFNSSVTDYTVEVTSKDSEITISASPWDDNAYVSGHGTKPIQLGENSFTIEVEAEDGKTKKLYTINIIVKEVPMIYLPYNNEQYGIMKEYKAVEVPKGFEPKAGTINDEDVTVFVNKKETLQLVYAANEDGQKDFYLYTAAEGILGLYRPLYVDGKEVYIVSIPENMQNRAAMAFATLTIDGEELQVWTFNDEELVGYSLMYIMGDDGKLAYYIYDQTNKTLTLYPDSQPITYDDFVEEGLIDKKPMNYGLYGGIAGGVLLIIGIVVMILRKKKNNVVEEEDEEEFIVNDEATKEFTFEKEEPVMEVHPIATDLEKIKTLDETDFEEEKPEDVIASLTSMISEAEVAVEDENDDWISEDFYKTILGEDD